MKCICKIIGDGKSIATAFRPAIGDVVDPKTGNVAFVCPNGWSDNGDGTASVELVFAAADVIARNSADYAATYAKESAKVDAVALVSGNTDILSMAPSL